MFNESNWDDVESLMMDANRRWVLSAINTLPVSDDRRINMKTSVERMDSRSLRETSENLMYFLATQGLANAQSAMEVTGKAAND